MMTYNEYRQVIDAGYKPEQLTGGSDPVISKEPVRAYTTAVTDKALGK